MTEEQTKILDRLQKLIKLATANPNVEEARSAAMMAVKLMVGANVHVGFPEAASPPPGSAPGVYSPHMRYDPHSPHDPYHSTAAQRPSINMDDLKRMWESIGRAGARPHYTPYDPFTGMKDKKP